MKPKTVLIVDDEISIRESLQKVLSKAGYATKTANSGNQALRIVMEQPVDIVLTDLKMPDGDGIDLLKKIRDKHPDMEVILLTGYGTIETAVEAMKQGAYDFITKPFKRAVILSTLERAVEHQDLYQENKYLKTQLGKSTPRNIMVGSSPTFMQVLEIIDRVAPLISTVLITGESGTGKELVARAVHAKSPRSQNQFIPINCAAIPENLVESELFGHVKGAFTGAVKDKEGLFKAAEGGTIFLDEILSVPLNLQVKLLRAIEQKEILPVGSTKQQVLDVRIIAATNRNLGQEVEKGNFREDLYYRLNVVGITIPPLRKRVEDIPHLVDHFIKFYNAQLNKNILGVKPEVLNAFMNYAWKGNVRELENAIERSIILCDEDYLTLSHFPHIAPQGRNGSKFDGHLKHSVRKFEQDVILKALKAANNDKAKAAKMLGLSLSSLYRKISELGIDSPDEPSQE